MFRTLRYYFYPVPMAGHWLYFLEWVINKEAEIKKSLPLPVIEKMLNQIYIMLFTFLTHIFWPDTGLNFTDMCFAEIEHTKA